MDHLRRLARAPVGSLLRERARHAIERYEISSIFSNSVALRPVRAWRNERRLDVAGGLVPNAALAVLALVK